MNQIESTLGQIQETAAPESSVGSAPTPRYREPQVFPIGTAVELLQRDITGHLKDGTGGWWVWGS